MLKIAKDPGTTISDLDREIIYLHQLKEKALAASLAVEEQQAKVIDYLKLEGKKTYSTTKAGAFARYKATLVQGTTVKYNEPGLKKALGATVWKKVTKTILDKKLLEDLVTQGDIDVHVVAENSSVNENKPYVRITPVTEDDD